jgi:hypothetical protein
MAESSASAIWSAIARTASSSVAAGATDILEIPISKIVP